MAGILYCCIYVDAGFNTCLNDNLVFWKSKKISFVLVIAWVAVKFGINTTLVVLEMGINFTRYSSEIWDKYHSWKWG